MDGLDDASIVPDGQISQTGIGSEVVLPNIRFSTEGGISIPLGQQARIIVVFNEDEPVAIHHTVLYGSILEYK